MQWSSLSAKRMILVMSTSKGVMQRAGRDGQGRYHANFCLLETFHWKAALRIKLTTHKVTTDSVFIVQPQRTTPTCS